ncbi:MAG: 1-acyl-sn-glycerol-3-phosphate acyltransferase [Leadbetterella sp.]
MEDKMEEGEILQIDIDNVLKTRAKSIYRFLPRFLISWFEGFIYQSEMNRILKISFQEKVKDIEMATFSVAQLGATSSSVGSEHIPLKGGVIIASNHPLGGMDGMILISECGKIRKDIKFIVNDLLLNLPNFENIFVGINKHGSTAKKSLLEIERLFASDGMILIFPAGLCSRLIKGKIVDLEWQKTFVAKSQKYGLPIIPTFIDGLNSNWFYRLARWRKKLGIKFNIEMIRLPREMFKQKGKHIQVVFGRPIPSSVFDDSKSTQEWANLLHDFNYTLKENPKAEFLSFVKKP